MAVAFTAILMIMVYNFYNATRAVYATGVAGQVLQDGVNTALSQMIQGKTEPTGVYRLSEAVSYTITSLSEMHFVGTDGIERWYKLNAGATQLIYHHPTTNGTVDEVIYQAPATAIMTLRFSIPTVANYSAAVVGIDLSIAQTVSGRAVSGAASTIVQLRNHP